MDNDLIVFMKSLLSSTWELFANCFIPGTDISFGALFVGLVVISVALGILSLVVGRNIAGEEYGTGVGGRKAKVSGDRMNDER